METVSVFVGLDYHQSSVQVCVMDRQGKLLSNRSCPNNWASIADAAEAHGQVAGVAIEACTGASNLAEQLIQQVNWSVHLAHPGFVNRMRSNPDKHDWGDARMLADLERVGYLPRVWLAPSAVRQLRQLVSFRGQLTRNRRDIKLRIGALLREERQIYAKGNAWTKKWNAWLTNDARLSEQGRWIIEQQLKRLAGVVEEIAQVEGRLTAVTREDTTVQALLKMKGIGPVTAWAMRAHIGRFDRFRTGKQLARFCGLSPRNASSGERQADAGLIQAGNPALRATIIEAAQRLIRYEPRWRQHGHRLRDRGKPYSVAVAAVANRWMRWLFHQMQPSRSPMSTRFLIITTKRPSNSRVYF
jgi:transposase